MRSKDQQGRPFTTLFAPRVSVLVNDVSNAVMHMLQAMLVNFADRYPSMDLDIS